MTKRTTFCQLKISWQKVVFFSHSKLCSTVFILNGLYKNSQLFENKLIWSLIAISITESVRYHSIFFEQNWHETIYFSVKPSFYHYIISSTQQDYQPPPERLENSDLLSCFSLFLTMKSWKVFISDEPEPSWLEP